MATFKVGQAVRIARHLEGPASTLPFVGEEGTVISALMRRPFRRPDGTGIVTAHLVQLKRHAVKLWCLPEELEPLTPRGDPLVAATELPPEVQEIFDKVFEHA